MALAGREIGRAIAKIQKTPRPPKENGQARRHQNNEKEIA